LIKPQEDINGVIEEQLEDDEMDITDLKNLMHAAATIVTLTLNEHSTITEIKVMYGSGK